MKLSKPLLQAILLGATMGAATSCAVFEDSEIALDEKCSKTCDEKCKEGHEDDTIPMNCPTCGMG